MGREQEPALDGWEGFKKRTKDTPKTLMNVISSMVEWY